MRQQEVLPCCLTIAGSDSGGNAGVQADLRAFHAFGLHGCTVFSALTAQNPFGVSAIYSLPVDFIARQLEAVLGVYSVRALKTGMLATQEIIHCVASRLRDCPKVVKVIDPVMVATSGAKLISDDAIEALKTELLSQATLITPNLPEAKALCGHEGEPEMLARELHEQFGCAVLVKGGHAVGQEAVDVLFDGKKPHRFAATWVKNPISTHGTGCSLAAALAAGLALGRNLEQAIADAKRYVHEAIAGSYYVGKDCGVLGFVKDMV